VRSASRSAQAGGQNADFRCGLLIEGHQGGGVSEGARERRELLYEQSTSRSLNYGHDYRHCARLVYDKKMSGLQKHRSFLNLIDGRSVRQRSGQPVATTAYELSHMPQVEKIVAPNFVIGVQTWRLIEKRGLKEES
jgi:hypothetical protein